MIASGFREGSAQCSWPASKVRSGPARINTHKGGMSYYLPAGKIHFSAFGLYVPHQDQRNDRRFTDQP